MSLHSQRGILGEGSYSLTNSQSRYQTEMSSQLQNSAALPPGKHPGTHCTGR